MVRELRQFSFLLLEIEKIKVKVKIKNTQARRPFKISKKCFIDLAGTISFILTFTLHLKHFAGSPKLYQKVA